MNVLMLRYSTYWCSSVLKHSDSVYLVVDSSKVNDQIPLDVLSAFVRVYRISSFDSLEEVSAVAADLMATGVRIDKVASTVEHTQYAAGYLSDLLGLQHYSLGIAMNTRDKRMMKMRAVEAGLSVPRHFSLPNAGKGADIAGVESEIGYPCVLKPANGSGTRSTSIVYNRAELDEALTDYDFQRDLRSHHLVAEEFVEGDEFHIDAVWRDGEPWTFFVSRYYMPRLNRWINGGLDGAVLLDEYDHAHLYAELREMNKRLVSTMGITRGTTHLEMYLEHGTDRLVFGEIASRPGGACVPEAVGAHCGVDERELWVRELLDHPRERITLSPGRFRYVAWLNLLPKQSGTISQVPHCEEIMADDRVITVTLMPEVGQELELHPACWGILMTIGGDSEADVIKTAEELSTAFPIEVCNPQSM